MSEKHQEVLGIIRIFSGSNIDKIYFELMKSGVYTSRHSIGNVLKILSIQNKIHIDNFRVYYVY